VIDLEILAEPGTFERQLLEEIDLARLPRHIAVIMDGNGRWAKQRGSPRVEGHRAGIASVRETVETCARLELDALTLYAFSVENWKRPRFEIVTLMSLLKEYLAKELSNLLKNDIRFRVVGRMNELDASVQKALSHGLAATSSCRGMTFNIALNYGGRTEIVDACRSLATDVQAGRLTPEQIDEENARLAAVHGGRARPRPPDPDERRDARLELPAVADRVQRDLGHADPLAGLPQAPPLRGDPRLPEARASLRRRHRRAPPVGRQRRGRAALTAS
jgi:undecaprenyl diphosphate synthase